MADRLCPIYLCDVYSLLNRVELDGCRQVSTRFEGTFSRYPGGSRPRHRVNEMIIDLSTDLVRWPKDLMVTFQY